jgi:hypothetical protein
MENNYFYCYSKRLMHFLKSMNFSFCGESINSNTKTKYWTFIKSEKLDKALILWNEIKNSL